MYVCVVVFARHKDDTQLKVHRISRGELPAFCCNLHVDELIACVCNGLSVDVFILDGVGGKNTWYGARLAPRCIYRHVALVPWDCVPGQWVDTRGHSPNQQRPKNKSIYEISFLDFLHLLIVKRHCVTYGWNSSILSFLLGPPRNLFKDPSGALDHTLGTTVFFRSIACNDKIPGRTTPISSDIICIIYNLRLHSVHPLLQFRGSTRSFLTSSSSSLLSDRLQKLPQTSRAEILQL